MYISVKIVDYKRGFFIIDKQLCELVNSLMKIKVKGAEGWYVLNPIETIESLVRKMLRLLILGFVIEGALQVYGREVEVYWLISITNDGVLDPFPIMYVKDGEVSISEINFPMITIFKPLKIIFTSDSLDFNIILKVTD